MAKLQECFWKVCLFALQYATPILMMMADKEALQPKSTGSEPGEESKFERGMNFYLGHAIHIFLSLLAVLILAAAVLATYETVIRVFPQLWKPVDEYSALTDMINNILLIAIAAELGLLLLFHRTSAAIEVIIFVIARHLVRPEIHALDLLFGAVALSGLLVVRFYYLPGKPK